MSYHGLFDQVRQICVVFASNKYSNYLELSSCVSHTNQDFLLN